MADFQAHRNQAIHNLDFLEIVNLNCDDHWDWQVTIAFYAAVHLINAHLAQSVNQHYRTHHDVDLAINFCNNLSPCSLPEKTYLVYKKLHNLSRRARYLIHEDDQGQDENRHHLTFDKHFKRAIIYLDEIIDYMKDKYSINCRSYTLSCLELKKTPLRNFKIKDSSVPIKAT